MRFYYFALVLFMWTVTSVEAGCITVKRSQVTTAWSIVDKELERWYFKEYRRRINFTCSDWKSDKALCMPDWMRNTPGMGGATPMTFCSVNVGTHRDVYLADRKTIKHWHDHQPHYWRRSSHKRHKRYRSDWCPFKSELIRAQQC